jgi:hypothetical protein
MRSLTLVLFLACASCHCLFSQSTETFNTVRFEDPSSIGSFVTIQPPSGISPYSLTLPSSLSSGTWTFKVSGQTGAMTWSPVFSLVGSDKQIAWFRGTDSVKGSSSLTWDDSQSMLTLVNAGTVSVSDTAFRLQNTSTSSTANVAKVGLSITSTGTLSGSGSSNTGLVVDAQGGASNYAALFVNGRVGVGTSTPAATLDVNGDVAFREVNYTTVLSTTANDVVFSTNNNYSYVRIAGAQTAAVTINGIAGGVSGKLVILYNATSFNITLAHEAAGSTAANRINSPGGTNVLITPGASVQVLYSGTESRWRLAFAGPGALSQFGNADVTVTNNIVLPTSTASYLRLTTGTALNKYTATLEDGLVKGQILVVQNGGPKTVDFGGTNIITDGSFNGMAVGDSILFVWNGTKWQQVARQSNA